MTPVEFEQWQVIGASGAARGSPYPEAVQAAAAIIVMWLRHECVAQGEG